MGVGPPWVCHALVPQAQSSWVLGLSYEVYIFSVLALVLSEIDQRQEATLFLFSLSFEYGCEKSVRQLTGFFRYVEIVIMKLYVYLNWMLYIKSPYLRISKISFFFIIMSSKHEEMFVWNVSIWVDGPCRSEQFLKQNTICFAIFFFVKWVFLFVRIKNYFGGYMYRHWHLFEHSRKLLSCRETKHRKFRNFFFRIRENMWWVCDKVQLI